MGARTLSASLAFAFSLLASTAAFAAAECKPEAYYSQRIQVSPQGYWAVPITIKGQRKFFSISTGGVTSSVRQSIVDEFMLPRGAAGYNLIDETGREYQPAQVRIPELRIGALQGDSLPFIVSEGGADGVIQTDILRNYDIELDYSARIFNILKPKKCREAVVHWPHDKVITLPLTLTEVNGHAFVPVRVDGVRLNAMISLGSVDSSVNAVIARARLKVDFDNPDLKQVGELQGPSYAMKIYQHTFKTIEFDDETVAEPTMLLMPDMVDRKISNQPYVGNLIRRQEEERREDVTLGMSILQNFHIYIAYSERRMYLTKSAAAPPL